MIRIRRISNGIRTRDEDNRRSCGTCLRWIRTPDDLRRLVCAVRWQLSAGCLRSQPSPASSRGSRLRRHRWRAADDIYDSRRRIQGQWSVSRAGGQSRHQLRLGSIGRACIFYNALVCSKGRRFGKGRGWFDYIAGWTRLQSRTTNGDQRRARAEQGL